MNSEVKEYSHKCNAQLKKYPSLHKYYDYFVGNIIIPTEDYNASTTIQEEVYSLLLEPKIKLRGSDHNWALEVWINPDDNVEHTIIRHIESYR